MWAVLYREKIAAQAAAHSKASISACRMMHAPDASVHGFAGNRKACSRLGGLALSPWEKGGALFAASALLRPAPTSKELGNG